MKKDLKSIMGLTQEETAMLLGISRVQWAHFTDGRRDIPSSAKIKLAEVLSTIQKNNSKLKEVTEIIAAEKKKAKEGLQQELKAIVLKEIELEKKIKKTNKVRKEAFAALEVVAYLEFKEQTSMAKFIKTRALNSLKKYNLQQLQDLELKKESLEMLKIQIDKKLKL